MEMRSLVTVRWLTLKFQYNKGGFAGRHASFARNCPATSECWNRLKNRQGGAHPPAICMNIKRKRFWLFGPSKDEMAAPEKKSGSKLPHSIRSYLQDKLYHRLRICQERF